MAQLIDGKSIAQKIKNDVQKRVEQLVKKGTTPELHVILVGNDEASVMYTTMKKKAAEQVGMIFKLHHLPEEISEKELVDHIKKIQADPNVSGLITQIPLPEHLYTEKVLNTIDPEIDIDCLTNTNLGRLVMNNARFTPPTPAAAMTILENLGVSVKGKNVTVIGTGALVGKPLAIMLINTGASVTTINSRSTNPKEKCLTADIIITGVGKKDILRGDMVKPGAIVIDTGIFREGNKVMGDINQDEVAKVASHMTPTPGGVGPITIASLLLNTVISAERKK